METTFPAFQTMVSVVVPESLQFCGSVVESVYI